MNRTTVFLLNLKYTAQTHSSSYPLLGIVRAVMILWQCFIVCVSVHASICVLNTINTVEREAISIKNGFIVQNTHTLAHTHSHTQ